MSIDFSWKLHSSVSDISSSLTGQKVKASSADAVTSRNVTEAKEDFKAWLEDETAKLAEQGISSTEAYNTVKKAVAAAAISGEMGVSSSDVTDLSEMKLLIDSLDKSILGNVASSLDSSEIAADLLSNGKSGERVIEGLVSGHLNSIVMTDSKDLEDADAGLGGEISQSLTDISTETLAQNLETIMEHLNQLGS